MHRLRRIHQASCLKCAAQTGERDPSAFFVHARDRLFVEIAHVSIAGEHEEVVTKKRLLGDIRLVPIEHADSLRGDEETHLPA